MQTDHLTESSLGQILTKLFGTKFIRNYQFRRYRLDWFCPINKICIEFDGYYHYSDAMTQYRDLKKDSLLNIENITVIRIPYFIQLSNDTLRAFFPMVSIDFEYDQTYPHGFISKYAMLPANFNEIGVAKFISNLKEVDSNTRYEILKSLIIKADSLKSDSCFNKLCMVFPISLLKNIDSKIDSLDTDLLIFNIINVN